MKTWMWIVLGIIVAAAIVWAVMYFMKPKKDAGLKVSVNNATPSTTSTTTTAPAGTTTTAAAQ